MSRTHNFFILLLALLVQTTVLAQATIFKSSADYGKSDFKAYESVEFKKGKLFLKDASRKEEMIDTKSEKVWGYRDQWGTEYRLDKGNALRILEFGKICVYVRKEIAETPATEEVMPVRQAKPYRMDKGYSFSIEPDGKMIKFSRSRFLKSLKGDSQTQERFMKHIKDNYDELLIKIIEYNDKFR